MAMMVVELHMPTNWAYEGTVDVLYVDAVSGKETSYGSLAQGSYMTRETFPGHTWNVRESTSRELLMSAVATPTTDGTPQIVRIGADGGLDPVKAAVWRMGQAPREPLLACTSILARVFANVLAHPDEPKYRSLRPSNEKVRLAMDVPGSLVLLSCAGFEQSFVDGEPRLVLPAGRPTAPIEAAKAQLHRLECLLTGRPPPSESLSSMQASHHAAQNAAQAASSAAADEPSHRCGHCKGGIQNDLRNMLRAGSAEIGGWRSHSWNGNGEYRFHCSKCNVDLCAKCYDQWKGGAAAIHCLQCSFAIEAPITTLWGGSSYGPPPAPPPVTSRNRRGPWG